MTDFHKTYNEELFPELSSYNRAINYPYFAPDYPFSFYKGRFVKDICFNLENRIPILSVGSNRSPYQLKRKFSLDEDICVTPAKLFDSDIVYAASMSAWKTCLAIFLLIFIVGVRISFSMENGSRRRISHLGFSRLLNLFLAARAPKSVMIASLHSSRRLSSASLPTDLA